jgi:hypothetical protein
MNANRIFLIDGTGACLSAVLLYTIGQFEAVFGLPEKVASLLALLPITFAMYAFFSHFRPFRRWRIRILSVANIIYCCITLAIIFVLPLSIYGILYFVGEKAIVIPLAVMEWKIKA